MRRQPRVSVIVPMYNEEKGIAPLLERLDPVLRGLGVSYEIVAVDDGSTDGTAVALTAAAERNPALRVVLLARNFGQHAAVLAGFAAARGEWCVTLDADLQNPPEEIPRIVDALSGGADLVHTYRTFRHDAWHRRFASRRVNAFMRRASGIQIRDFGCMLRGYHRTVVTAVTRHPQTRTFVPALAALYARHPVEIPVGHAARDSGQSKYSLWRLFQLHLDLVVNFSTAPLRVLFGVGAIISMLGMLSGVGLLVLRLVHGPEWAAEGVFTLFSVLFFFVGAQFVAFGLLGEYLGRIHQEVVVRPPYVVRRIVAAEAVDSEPQRDDAPLGIGIAAGSE